MLQTIISRLGWFVLLLFLQVLVFNHIHITGYATPLPYVYFLLILPGNTPRWLYVALGFIMGLAIDLFTNTPGMAAASLCACGLLAPLPLKAFKPSDKELSEMRPSSRSMKWGGFLRYAASMTFIQCTLFFVIEAFSFSSWQPLLINIGGSSVLTMLFIYGLERLRSRRPEQ